MHRALLATIVTAACLLWARDAIAEQSAADEVDDGEVYAIDEGEEAPFAGMLFPPELAIRMGFRIENLELRLSADLTRERERCQVERRHDAEVLRLEQERREFEIDQLERTVHDQAAQIARPTPWHRRWGFAFGMGVLVSVLLVGSGVAIMIAIS